MTPTGQLELGQDNQNKKKNTNIKVALEKLGKNFGFISACSNMFAGLPLEAEGSSFSPRLSRAAALVAPALQMQSLCPANPQACPELTHQVCHPVVDKTTYYPVLVGSLSKENTAKPPHLLEFGQNFPLGHPCPNMSPTPW